MALTTRTVTGTYQRTDGTAVSGSVTFAPNTALSAGANDLLLPAKQVTAALNTSGTFTATLVCTDNAGISPTGWAYTVTERISGLPARIYTISVPAGAGSLDLADVTPLDPAPALVQYVLAGTVGQIGGPAGPLDGSGDIPVAQIPSLSSLYTPTTRLVSAGAGLTGGGDLTADRTLTVSYGTTAGTAAQGNDSRITGAAQKTSNLSDLASASTALANLGVPDASALWPASARMPRFVQPSSVITTFQSGHGWTSSGTGATFNLNDTGAGNFISGTQAASVTTGANASQANIRKFAGSVPDTTGKVFRIRIKVDDVTHLNELDFYCGSSSLANTYKWSFQVAGGNAYVTSGDWCTVTLSFANATTSGTPARSGMTDLQFQVWDDGAGTVTAHIQSVELIPDGSATFPNGVVSICFDDSWSSPQTLGAFSKLDAAGYPASLFTITDQLGSANHLTLADLKTRVDRFGWESCAHANTDANHTATYTGLTASALDADLRAQRAWLMSNGVRVGDGTAYPLGQFGRTSDAAPTTDYVRRYCSWARTTHNRTTETFPPADPYRIRAISSISTFAGGNTPSSITTAGTGRIATAKANAAWLVLVFHKIVSSGPASTTECAIADFNAIVDAITTAAMPVYTVGDVLRYYG